MKQIESLICDVVNKDQISNAIERIELFNKVKTIVDHYSKLLEYPRKDILEAIEKHRKESVTNYYTEQNYPTYDINVYQNLDALKKVADPKNGFRCPHCKGVSMHPYICDSGVELVLMNSKGKKEPCNWKSFGLFGTLGEGIRFTLRDTFLEQPFIDECFMPLDLEKNEKS